MFNSDRHNIVSQNDRRKLNICHIIMTNNMHALFRIVPYPDGTERANQDIYDDFELKKTSVIYGL